MGIEGEIREHLSEDVSPKDLIDKFGFKRSTVYKVYHQMVDGGVPLTVKKRHRIIKLTRMFNDVEMLLRQISTVEPLPPPVQEKVPEYQKQIVFPVARTDEEHVASNLIDGLKKFAPGLKQALEGQTSPIQTSGGFITVGPEPKSLIDITVTLSSEDYANLGSPGLDGIIEVSFKQVREIRRARP